MKTKIYVASTKDLDGKSCSLRKSDAFPICLYLEVRNYSIEPDPSTEGEHVYVIRETKQYKYSKIALIMVIIAFLITLIYIGSN